MFGKEKPPGAEPVYEAMAETLNPNSSPYSHAGIVFPPGEWVPIPAQLVERFALLPWATVRPIAESS